MTEPTATERRDERVETRPRAVLGVIVAPGLAHDVTSRIASELLQDLRARYDSVDWHAELEVDRLVVPPASLTEIFAAGRRRLLEGDWDLGVVVTDLPLKVGGRPVSRHLSPTHSLAVLSLPALGALHLRQRLRRALVELIGELTGPEAGDEWEESVLRELATDTGHRSSLLYVPVLVAGHFRLLLGMIAQIGRGVWPPGCTAPWSRRSPWVRSGLSAATSGSSPARWGGGASQRCASSLSRRRRWR